MFYGADGYLSYGPTVPLFSNKFAHLTHLSIKGHPSPPDDKLLSDFLLAHPSLSHFAFHGFYSKAPTLPSGVLPCVEYLEGRAPLLAAICTATSSPRTKLTRIHGVGWGTAQHSTRDIFLQAPFLQSLHIDLIIHDWVSPEWIEYLGKSCPELQSLALHDPIWVGNKVCCYSPRDIVALP